ncbi:MAG: DUF6088 family protein [Gammaproteobacteria bacterium]|nr:DUF6088 family protein [Gammaproteobacteria bacterium]
MLTLSHSLAERSRASRKTATVVRSRIENGGERLWRFEDFIDQPFPAVAKALSRLAREGVIERLSKGTYYRTRHTAFGKSQPNPAALQKLASRGGIRLLPSGVAAANLLGFTTQNAKKVELATSASSVPRKLIGKDTVVHTRRPEAWSRLCEIEAAMLDFLRHSGKASELSPQETIEKTLSMLAKRGCFQRLVNVAKSEPPRVRAMLGALGENLGKDSRTLNVLRSSLNSLSRFDFGIYTALPNAQAWYAKGRH